MIETTNTNKQTQPAPVKLREDELDIFFKYRSQFLELMSSYASRSGVEIDRNKIFGVLYDTIFFVGICSLRQVVPSMKDIYLEVGESRSASLRHVEYLDSIGVFERHNDTTDTRRKCVSLSDEFSIDFKDFIETWLDTPRKTPPLSAPTPPRGGKI